MGKQREGGPPATWDLQTTLIYCSCCIKEIELGNRPNTHFNREGWDNLTKNFNNQTQKNFDRSQLKNKWDQLKKEWKIWKDLLRGETGIGWNPIKKTVDASNEWWNDKLQVVPAAKKFRYFGIAPELEEKLDIMFKRIVAVGDDAWIPNSGVLPPDMTEATQTPTNDNNSDDQVVNIGDATGGADFDIGATERNKSSAQLIRKRRRIQKTKSVGKQLFVDHMEDLVVAARSISASMVSTSAPVQSLTIYEAVDKISGIPELVEDFDLFYYASSLMRDRLDRELFMSVPDGWKVRWIRRHFDESTTNH